MSGNKRDIALADALKSEILILDGAMGTMIQQAGTTEAHYHGAGIVSDRMLKGCNDLLCLTAPDIVLDIHRQYLDAGADIIETNSFNANRLSLREYGVEEEVRRINAAAAALARRAVESHGAGWVAGSVGPTGKSLSMSQSLDDGEPVSWDELYEAYLEQISALIEGGVDILLIETVFDGLNAKAAIAAAQEAMETVGREVPVMISVTLTESGRTLSGQTLDAFVATVAHARPMAVGLNCGFGAAGMRTYIEQLQAYPFAISMYPNAGLPNAMGEYDESPDDMAHSLRPLLEARMLNIVGGCCGTTPAHIKAIADMAKDMPPRIIPDAGCELDLAGLELLPVRPERNFLNIGERCNVAGSRKFLRLINEGNIEEAVDIARTQVVAGAQIVDVNMDDAMLDAEAEMDMFVARIGSEPDVARVPVMIDSSKWEVICGALKRIQGKPVVNSISLKEGEEAFVAKARHIRRMGAAMVVMAFDEDGQADTYSRKTAVCTRAYRLLTEVAGIPGSEIIFDPNILAVATGIEAHNNYALDFIRATEYIKNNLRGAKVSGGLSNLSFSFRGNNYMREAIHSVFLYHAVKAGMDMAIVNAASLMPVDDIPSDLREAIEDVLFNRRADATERLLAIADDIKSSQAGDRSSKAEEPTENLSASDKVERMLVRGVTDGMEALLDEAVATCGSALGVIDGPLMGGMNRVGALFGEGKMFLPQVVKSARAMRYAVSYLTPLIEAEKASGGEGSSSGKVVIATVKGDVHDIGKNIVDVIMNCNGYDMIDLGVMVPAETIVERAVAESADFVGLSGLITPSLEEMCHVAKTMERHGLKIPLLIGGATTSALHTAVRIAPCYSGPVIHTRDAAVLPSVVQRFSNPDTYRSAVRELHLEQSRLREEYTGRPELIGIDEALIRRHIYDESLRGAVLLPDGIHDITIPVAAARELINWRQFFWAWKLDASLASIADIKGCDHCRAQWLAAVSPDQRMKAAQAMQLWKEASRMLDRLETEFPAGLKARVVVLPAASDGESIMLTTVGGDKLALPVLRQQSGADECLSLADFVAPVSADGGFSDRMALFAVTVGNGIQRKIEDLRDSGDDYGSLLVQSLADRLVEAATELVHRQTLGEGNGIRPAFGYPSLPDQSLLHIADHVLDYSGIGITVTENGAMTPLASTSGMMIPYAGARYFTVGTIGNDQRVAYARRRGIKEEDLLKFIP